MGSVRVHALRNVSLAIKPGEFVAIMGPSGSGKSTLLHVVGFLDRPDSGSYHVAKKDITELTDEELAILRNRLAGFIFQQFHLLPRISAVENTELPLIYAGSRHLQEKAHEKLQAVGLAQAALDDSVKYAKEREQFGRPIGKFQAIQWKLAEMATKIAAARLLVHRAAYLKDAGKSFTKESAMAKLYASKISVEVANEAVQIHGGYGYTKDYPVERYFREAKVTEIYEGTSEVQRIVIARQVLSR